MPQAIIAANSPRRTHHGFAAKAVGCPEDFSARLTCVRLAENDFSSSCGGLTCVSTSLFRPVKAWMPMDLCPWAEGPRVAPGQDEIGAAILLPLAPEQFPPTARLPSGGRRSPNCWRPELLTPECGGSVD